jgi:hypothetical protein
MSELQPTETAPKDGTDVIVQDNHGFVSRMKFVQHPVMGWKPFGSLHARFNDDELIGWISLPEPPCKDNE